MDRTQVLFVALLLAAIFGLLITPARIGLRDLLHGRPGLIRAVPFLLTGIFAAAALLAGALTTRLILMVLAYTAAPVICAARAGSGFPKRPGWLDFAVILLLWLPLEFAAGAAGVPRAAQGFLHSVAYGIAILLGLIVFTGYRSFEGLKYNLPSAVRDIRLPLAAFLLLAPVLAALGIAIGFLPAPHWPVRTAGTMAGALGIIFAGTALPEEILFRSLLQNLLMLRFGATTSVLVVSSVIFGAAHLDNGPQALPNWRYMILATIAGYAYGRVFQKSGTVVSSALLHTLVDWTKHFFF